MSVRRPANDIASLQVQSVKRQITAATSIDDANLSTDQMIRLAAKQGFQIIVSCVRVEPYVVSDKVFESVESILRDNPMYANKALLELMARKPGWSE